MWPIHLTRPYSGPPSLSQTILSSTETPGLDENVVVGVEAAAAANEPEVALTGRRDALSAAPEN